MPYAFCRIGANCFGYKDYFFHFRVLPDCNAENLRAPAGFEPVTY